MQEHLATDPEVMRWLGIRSRHTLRKLVARADERGLTPPFVILNRARRWTNDLDALWAWVVASHPRHGEGVTPTQQTPAPAASARAR
jgi:hypothetical protein